MDFKERRVRPAVWPSTITLLPGIAAGETIATLARVEDNGRWDAEGTALTATAVGGKTFKIPVTERRMVLYATQPQDAQAWPARRFSARRSGCQLIRATRED